MGMQSLKQLYKIGKGPSSSHTMGPEKACKIFKANYPDADKYKVILYNSLSLTGKGHGTDRVIEETFLPVNAEIVFCSESLTGYHPNTMDLLAYAGDTLLGQMRVFSIGGGEIEIEGVELPENKDVYEQDSFFEIAEYCKANNMRIWQYVQQTEGTEILDYLMQIWRQMKATVEAGLNKEGILPGGLNVSRKARHLYTSNHIDERAETKENRLVCAYAFAASEENASCGTIVTAPTCGACGVLPSILYYHQQKCGFSDTDIVKALATAGIVGMLIKTNASISGAECGCQAEIGTACSMAAAALAELYAMSIEQIEYAAEIAIEHHLGLTCDPICGLVQIPCIERNAVAAMRAINAVNLANFLVNTRKISFDLIVKTMYETGIDLLSHYRETSTGGMAKLYPTESR